MNFTVWAKFRHTFDVHYTFFAAEKSFIVWFISHFYSVYGTKTLTSHHQFSLVSGWIFAASRVLSSIRSTMVMCVRHVMHQHTSSISHAHQWIQLFLHKKITWPICETQYNGLCLCASVCCFGFLGFSIKNILIFFHRQKWLHRSEWMVMVMVWSFGEKNLIPNNCY